MIALNELNELNGFRPFEKERTTYCSDPYATAQHQEKFRVFIESKIGLNDAEICLKGRSLLDINGVILSYFEQLVPDEVDEVTFWRRYFYWKYQWHLREILISKHSSDHKQDIDDDEDDDENENADEVRLGDCENVKGTDVIKSEYIENCQKCLSQ